MQHSAEQIAEDETRIESGHCPECHVDLSTIDARAHADYEFPGHDASAHDNTDYGRRARLVVAWAEAKAHPKPAA